MERYSRFRKIFRFENPSIIVLPGLAAIDPNALQRLLFYCQDEYIDTCVLSSLLLKATYITASAHELVDSESLKAIT